MVGGGGGGGFCPNRDSKRQHVRSEYVVPYSFDHTTPTVTLHVVTLAASLVNDVGQPGCIAYCTWSSFVRSLAWGLCARDWQLVRDDYFWRRLYIAQVTGSRPTAWNECIATFWGYSSQRQSVENTSRIKWQNISKWQNTSRVRQAGNQNTFKNNELMF